MTLYFKNFTSKEPAAAKQEPTETRGVTGVLCALLGATGVRKAAERTIDGHR